MSVLNNAMYTQVVDEPKEEGVIIHLPLNLRMELAAIAEEELRTLENQILIFLRRDVKEYLQANHLRLDSYNDGHKLMLVPEDAPTPAPEDWCA